MRVRPYTEADLDALKAMHARQGFDYPLPDLSNPTFVSKLVLEADDPNEIFVQRPDAVAVEARITNHESRVAGGAGNCTRRVVMASLARLTCEIYLLADPRVGTPRERYARLLVLHNAAERHLFARGLDDVHAWLPPRIAKRFGRRLERLGWVRDDAWTPYSKRLIRDA